MKESILTTIVTFIVIGTILVGGIWFLAHNKKEQNLNMTLMNKPHQNIRSPAVAGSFYPASEKELTGRVDDFLVEASPQESAGAILGLIVPHAGYDYSGLVAGYGFKQLENQNMDTVILIGNSHHAYFEGAAVYPKGYFKTPLGEVEIDSDLARKIINENKIIKADSSAHELEHSLEVEVPFLQRTLKDFKLVPILMGSGDFADVEILAGAIAKNIKNKNAIVVASSDMSHYPSYEMANYADKKTYEAILTGQVEKLEAAITQLENEKIPGAQTFLCGKDAVEVLMLVMQDLGANDIKLLKYANSGDASGDKSQVVGYSAIGFYSEQPGSELNLKEQQRLLEIAKESVESYIKTGRLPEFSESAPVLNQKLGAFVTLKKQGQLRGCIGSFSSENNLPLYKTVVQMALAAATDDPRFTPVKESELPFLEYEISVLSPLQKIDDWQQIELGKHGVEIKKGGQSGVFLPQVAKETGWDLETFLGQLCSQKAGLPWDCWKESGTELYIFKAQVFARQ